MSNKQTGRMALAGVLTALALVCLLLTFSPLATVGLAALAGVCGIPVVIELDRKAGLIHYAAVAVLAAILALSAEGTGLYIAFFGWYTVFKAFIEGKHLTRPMEWGIKIAVFAAAMAAYGAVWVFLLQMPIPHWFAVGMLPVLAVGLCAVFVVYDIGLTGLIGTYFSRIRPKMSNLFRF